MIRYLRPTSGDPVAAALRLALPATLLSIAASPSAAQYYGYNTPAPPAIFGGPAPVFRGYQRPLPPDDIVDRLEERGFEDVGRPRFDGSNYLVEAVNPRGLRVRLVIDAFRGHVIDRVAVGRDSLEREIDESPRFAPRPTEPRNWFGNNAPPPLEPGGRSVRIDPPGAIETAPLDPPRAERGLPAPRDPSLAPRSQPERSATLPRSAKPSVSQPSVSQPSVSQPSVSQPSVSQPGAPQGVVEGGNPDVLKGEQRRPVASAPSPAPAVTSSARPINSAPQRPVASAPVQPVPAAEPSKPENAKVESAKTDSAKTDSPKTEALSPIRPLKPQVAPEVAQTGETPQRTVRVIGGVTPVPAPAGDAKGGAISADSTDVKP